MTSSWRALSVVEGKTPKSLSSLGQGSPPSLDRGLPLGRFLKQPEPPGPLFENWDPGTSFLGYHEE